MNVVTTTSYKIAFYIPFILLCAATAVLISCVWDTLFVTLLKHAPLPWYAFAVAGFACRAGCSPTDAQSQTIVAYFAPKFLSTCASFFLVVFCKTLIVG